MVDTKVSHWAVALAVDWESTRVELKASVLAGDLAYLQVDWTAGELVDLKAFL